MPTSGIPPEWYPDPHQPGLLRWWNGGAWTEHAQWAPVLPVFRHDPRADLRGERRAARWLGVALLFYVPLSVAQYVLSVLALHTLGDALRDFSHTDGGFSNSDHHFTAPSSFHRQFDITELLGLGALAVGVLLMVWLFRAATLAARAGLPARHSPVWAVFGLLIPIISLWFPYQMVRDLLPPGHPSRRTVNFWWASWLGTSIGAVPVFVVSLFSVSIGLLLAGCLAVVLCWMVVLTHRVLADVGAAHARLLGL